MSPAPLLAVLASAALPIAMEALGSALGRSSNPAVAAAGEAVAVLNQAIVRGEVPADEVAHIEADLNRLFELENARLGEVNETMRVEASAEDPWVRRWRPFFGYSVAVAWLIQMLAVSAAILLAPHTAPALLMALGEGTAMQWSIALAVLGVSVYARSKDKGSVSGSPITSALGRVAQAVRGDNSQVR